MNMRCRLGTTCFTISPSAIRVKNLPMIPDISGKEIRSTFFVTTTTSHTTISIPIKRNPTDLELKNKRRRFLVQADCLPAVAELTSLDSIEPPPSAKLIAAPAPDADSEGSQAFPWSTTGSEDAAGPP